MTSTATTPTRLRRGLGPSRLMGNAAPRSVLIAALLALTTLVPHTSGVEAHELHVGVPGPFSRLFAGHTRSATSPLSLAGDGAATGQDRAGLVGLQNGAAPPPFDCSASYAVGSGPYALAEGDVNGDGKPDLVTANYGSGSTGDTVGVSLNKGNGAFGPAASYTVGWGPAAVALSDVNGDGKPDIVTANAGFGTPGDTVSVLLNAGNGTFGSAASYTVGSGPAAVALADVNGDGKPDLVTADYAANTVSVLLNAGNGTFGSATSYTVGVGAGPTSVVVGDLNGDHKPDIVTANFGFSSPGNSVSVLLNAGNGTFGSAAHYGTGPDPFSAALGDVNGDGKLDIVTANYGFGGPGNNVSVLLGNGNGTFGSAASYAAGAAPAAVALGDVNGDGKPDIVTANYAANTISVLPNGKTCLALAPSSGYPTQPVRLSGGNFGSGEAVNIYLDNSGTTPLTTVEADVSGAIGVTITVPTAPYGAHKLIAVGQQSGLTATAPFQITPLLVLTPASGPAGERVKAAGSGFGAKEQVVVVWNGQGGTLLGTTTSSGTGGFAGPTAVAFTVPAAPPGTYDVCAQGQSTRALICRGFTVT